MAEREWRRLADVLSEKPKAEMYEAQAQAINYPLLFVSATRAFWIERGANDTFLYVGRCIMRNGVYDLGGWDDILVRPLPPGTKVTLVQPEHMEEDDVV